MQQPAPNPSIAHLPSGGGADKRVTNADQVGVAPAGSMSSSTQVTPSWVAGQQKETMRQHPCQAK